MLSLNTPAKADAVQPDIPRDTAAWLRGIGIPAPTPRIGVIGRGWGHDGYAILPDRLLVPRQILAPLKNGGAGEILLHELLHLAGSGDEGVTEAVALDLLPAWNHRFRPRSGVFVMPTFAYHDQVTAVRQKSADATGEPWTSTAARLWRRSLIPGYSP